jgi:hypothetical protein
MMVSATFQELLRCAREAGITIRHVPLGGSGGGLAQVRGKPQLFVDTDADPEDQLERTVEALKGIEQIRKLAIRPDVKRLFEQ